MNYITIAKEWGILWEMLEASQGELTPEIEGYMEQLKADSVSALFSIQDLREQADMSAKMCKERAAEYVDKAKRIEKASANLKSIQIALMQASGQKTLQNGIHKITLTQNPVRVDVVDEEAIPASYRTAEVKLTVADWDKVKDTVKEIAVKFSVDKKSITELYKVAQVEIAGVEYVREPNVRVS